MKRPSRLLATPLLAMALLASPAPRAAESAAPPARARPAVALTPAEALAARLRGLGAGFDGRSAIAVKDLQTGWVAESQGLTLSPQQSVSKLWVALTVFDAVDRGVLRLDQPVVVSRDDMSVFHQPIQEHLDYGAFHTTLEALLIGALAQSDNAANDILMRLVGGHEAVQAALAARGMGAIHGGPEEKVLQSRIAAVEWRPEYSFGRAFWTARDLVDPNVRAAALNRYLAEPEDGATAVAIVEALGRLKAGALLSPASTTRFLDILATTETGPMRLKGGLPPGWTIAHKTGTGQDLGDRSTGFNDVGLITAPDGHGYAVAVMIASTRRPVPERQQLMSSVARAVAALHDGTDLWAGAPLPAPHLE